MVVRRFATLTLAALAASLAVPVVAHAASAPCASADLSTGGIAGAPAGTAVALTASSTGCATPEYRFWLQPPGGAWMPMTSYGASTSWTWQTSHATPLGVWGVGVWARDQGSPASYEAYYIGTVTLLTDACAPVSLNANGTGPSWDLAADTSCPAAQYRFWMLPPGGSWTVVHDWQTANTYTFTAPSSGTYELGVWARNPASGTAYDSFAITTVFAGDCQIALGSTGGQDSVYQGVAASVSVGMRPCSPSGLEYQFWLLVPGSGWTVEQPYSTQSWWNWSTAGFAPGVYQYGIWAKSTSSAAAYDGYFIGTITVLQATCFGASLAPDLSSPQAPGPTVTFSASAGGVCGGMGEVQFWVLPPNSSTWTVAKPYVLYNNFNAPTFAWNTTGLAPGPYRIGVWIRGWRAGAINKPTYDTYAIVTYWLLG